MTKPFSNRELLARIKAHLRRTETIETAAEESSNSGKQEISIGELIIVPDAFVAKNVEMKSSSHTVNLSCFSIWQLTWDK